MIPIGTPVIPSAITVHLAPPDDGAENVTVSFVDYIKNVASSEIYPTWPENALRANIYCQISFAMNRVYTEYYRSRGYPFDITSSTAYDQYFVKGRTVFANISRIVDEIFNSYVRKGSGIEPYFTQYCNGTSVTCDGLSQWGTVELAEDGYLPYQILEHYYGSDVFIVSDAPVADVSASFAGIPLKEGVISNTVKDVQLRLNRISVNYPSIPKIYPTDGVYAVETANAVRAFQEEFDLTPDGVVGSATWYAIERIFNAVKRLNELDSEGLSYEEIGTQFPRNLKKGDSGIGVRIIQYYLSFISVYVNEIPPTPVTGSFDEKTEEAVLAFQRLSGLEADGIVGVYTWYALYNYYRGLVESQPDTAFIEAARPFPGTFLVRGSEGDDVRTIQENLSVIATVYPEIPAVPSTGYYGTLTYNSVYDFQEYYGIEPTGAVGPVTWTAILTLAADIRNGNLRSEGQYTASTTPQNGNGGNANA